MSSGQIPVAALASNLKMAEQILLACREQGVQDYCVCAGARNSPLVFLLEKSSGANLFSFFDERSAAFFATGRIQASQRPVAVITTSGTAVAELLPAAVEASYSGWPLILITADRPRSYRGTGAPQSIDQVGIFSRYVETCLDIESPDEPLRLSDWTKSMPVQINACFKEPLIDGEVKSLDLSALPCLKRKQHFRPSGQIFKLSSPLIIAGRIASDQIPMVVSFLERFGAPIYAEALSQLRGEPKLSHLLLKSDDLFVNSLFQNKMCNSVLRLGGVPTLRFWRDLEETFLSIPVYNVSDLEFTGLSRSSKTLLGIDSLTQIQMDWSKDQRPQIFRADLARQEKILNLLQQFPNSEAAMIFDLSKKLSQQNLYLGNSLPIREWDLVASTDLKLKNVFAARGANGIDGQLSAFLGANDSAHENWAIVGDLTALYDLQSLWITSQIPKAKRRLVVVNNKGGMIFKKMFKNDIFLNSHQLDFSHWAKMFGWAFIACNQVESLQNLPDQVLIELNPDSKQSDQFWLGMKGLNI